MRVRCVWCLTGRDWCLIWCLVMMVEFWYLFFMAFVCIVMTRTHRNRPSPLHSIYPSCFPCEGLWPYGPRQCIIWYFDCIPSAPAPAPIDPLYFPTIYYCRLLVPTAGVGCSAPRLLYGVLRAQLDRARVVLQQWLHQTLLFPGVKESQVRTVVA